MRGPRGQEMLLPASLEGEGWDGGDRPESGCLVIQAAQESWAAGGHGRNALSLEAKQMHSVLPQNGAHTPGWCPRLVPTAAGELYYRVLSCT